MGQKQIGDLDNNCIYWSKILFYAGILSIFYTLIVAMIIDIVRQNVIIGIISPEWLLFFMHVGKAYVFITFLVSFVTILFALYLDAK